MSAVALHLDDLAARINEATSAAETSARAAVAHALAAGNLLLQAKAQVEHGDWEPWLLANCAVAPRTARAYMSLARRLPALPDPERQRVAEMPLREAVAAIRTTPEAPPLPRCRPGGIGQATKLKPVFKAAGSALHSIASDVGLRSIKHDRIKALRSKLQAALAALDSMVEVANE